MKLRIQRCLSLCLFGSGHGQHRCSRRPHRSRSRTIAILSAGLLIALVLCSPQVFAATVNRPGITPVQAELMTEVNAHLVKVGAIVYARVAVDWQGTDCSLRNGAILEAHVLSVSPYRDNGKTSQLDLAFTRAQCGAPKLGAFNLMLAAIAAPPQNSDLGIITAALPLSTSGAGGLAALKTMQMSSSINLHLDTPVYQFPISPRMQMGDVSGIKGLKLSVGAGLENSTALVSKGRDVSLEKHTLLLLVPAQGTFPRMNASAGSSQPIPAGAAGSVDNAASPAQPPVDDLDICAPPQCNVALPQGTAKDGLKPAASISIRELGYAPRPQKQMDTFDQDEVLTYLSGRELLVTFNPHILAPRHALGASGYTVRVIRAALLDTETHRVMRTVDWESPDNHEYLWPLGQGRVLVHVGSELRVYGEGLELAKRIPLDGPLAFVRVTPDGNFAAVGVIHEGHTPDLHAELTRSLNRDPDEDVDVLVLNRNFEPIAKSTARSGLMPPTLLNEGQAKLLAQAKMHYRISMLTWDNQAFTVARFNSSCTPELSSFAPDLIFLVSCDKRTDVREFRVLHWNGKLSLKGGSSPDDYGFAVKGSEDRGAFVVKTVQSSNPVALGEQVKAADLSSDVLGVYRATDGKRLLDVRVGSPSSSRDGYALAPDSSQLAVLTRDQISIYSVAKN